MLRWFKLWFTKQWKYGTVFMIVTHLRFDLQDQMYFIVVKCMYTVGDLFVSTIRFTGIIFVIDGYCLAYTLLLYITQLAGVGVKAGGARTSGGVVGVRTVGTVEVVDHLRNSLVDLEHFKHNFLFGL